MALLVNPAELAHIQSTYPYLNIRPLNGQQERFLLLVLRGISVTAAENAVGYAKGSGASLLREEHVAKIFEYYKQNELKDIRVSRDTLTQMLFESHSKAASAMEEIAAVRELGKMHDVYESDKRKTGITIQNNTLVNNNGAVTTSKQVERMSDEQLMKIAGMPSLDPVASTHVLEHVCEGELVENE